MGFKMTDILPPAGWPNVRQLETNEFASGGANGNMNEQAKSLAARSELLKQHAALPYESKTGGYALNERVQLATGDIVRSTIPSNVNNPNVNMTGWKVPSLKTAENLSDVPNKAAARINLSVYSQTEVDTAIANATPTIPNATTTDKGIVQLNDTLTSTSKTQALTAAQGKALQDNKLEANKVGVANGVASLDVNTKVPVAQLPAATTTSSGAVQLNNTLTSVSTTQALTAAQGKALQDNKLEANKVGVANGVASLDANTKVPVAQLPNASTTAIGAVQLNDTLTSVSTSQALTAAQGKALQDNKLEKTGVAVAAKKLEKPFKLNGVDVDGSKDVTIQASVTESELKLLLNATGTAPIFACRAWVDFEGGTTPTMRANGNILSVIRNSSGDYTLNFLEAMPSDSYALFGMCSTPLNSGVPHIVTLETTSGKPKLKTSLAVRISVKLPSTGNPSDTPFVFIGVVC